MSLDLRSKAAIHPDLLPLMEPIPRRIDRGLHSTKHTQYPIHMARRNTNNLHKDDIIHNQRTLSVDHHQFNPLHRPNNQSGVPFLLLRNLS